MNQDESKTWSKTSKWRKSLALKTNANVEIPGSVSASIETSITGEKEEDKTRGGSSKSSST